MNESIYGMYCRTKSLIERAEACEKGHRHTAEMLVMLQGWRESNEVLETALPELKNIYRRRQEVINSFTPEQRDHICYMIGEWYMEMKPLLEGQHNLGYMKETLKTMICGE